MNITELKEELTKIVAYKFKQQYPQIFTVSTTKDKDVYNSCPHGYKWYIDIINDIGSLSTRTYKIDGFTFYNGDFSDAYRMLEDAKNTDNIVIWCFLNIDHN